MLANLAERIRGECNSQQRSIIEVAASPFTSADGFLGTFRALRNDVTPARWNVLDALAALLFLFGKMLIRLVR